MGAHELRGGHAAGSKRRDERAAPTEVGTAPRPGGRRSTIASVYDRIAPFYDWFDAPMYWLGGRYRRGRVISPARGRVLEIGVGTGRNLGLYQGDVALTAIDISAGMLRRARRRAARLARHVDFRLADAAELPFEDGSFDTVTATCVFCSVADPVRGLAEAARVLAPGGTVRLLEHVRPRTPILGKLFDWLSPLTRRLVGPEINRRTEENVGNAGLELVQVRRNGVWREIVARPLGRVESATAVKRREGGERRTFPVEREAPWDS